MGLGCGGHYMYDELLAKCDHRQFSNGFDYNYEKLKVANELYAAIIVAKNNTHALIKLREKAVKELGVRLSSEDLYNTLLKQTNPQRLMNPFNRDG